jgi:hypothetical protein
MLDLAEENTPTDDALGTGAHRMSGTLSALNEEGLRGPPIASWARTMDKRTDETLVVDQSV